MTQLGADFRPSRGLAGPDALSVLESFAARVEASVEASVMVQVRAALAALSQPAPQVTVNPPLVEVAAPTVHVAPVAEVVVDLDELRAELAGLRADLQAHTAALLRPTTRTIHRDADSLIASVTESR